MKQNKLLVLIFAVVYIVVYWQFFSSSPLAWGDAPFFYSQNLKELFNLPLLWDSRNSNFGMSQAGILWLYLPTFLYGLLSTFFGFENYTLIRVVFYLPATILAILGSWLFIGQFVKNSFARFLGTFLYSFNTYFLLLLDGGQLGVALAYGIFPIVVLSLYRFIKESSIKNFLYGLICLFIISNTDLRVAIVAILFAVVLFTLEAKVFYIKFYIKHILILSAIAFVCLILMNLFWIMPLVMFSSKEFSLLNSSSATESVVSIIDSLFLYQPQFPLNEFGIIIPIPFYFGFIPILLLSGFLIKLEVSSKERKLLIIFAFLYLFFAFLTKGSNQPFGNLYSLGINNIPFGVAFRDSTKFFVPLLLASSCLLGISLQMVCTKFKNDKLKNIFVGFVFIFLLLLILPALKGDLTGALGAQKKLGDYNRLYSKLSNEGGFFRTIWFNDVPPLGFSDWERPSISANLLFKERPFASMTTGSYDLYGFLHSRQLNSWFNLLGIKYAFFPESQRKKEWSTQEREDRKQFEEFVSSVPGFKTLDWDLSFPSFQIDQGRGHIFGQSKAVFVLGGEGVYNDLFNIKEFDLSRQSIIFLEDSRVKVESLSKVEKADAIMAIEKDKGIDDLAMVFAKNKLIGFEDSVINQWAYRASSEYLKWKYDLLVRGVNTFDFDFNKGVVFSTILNERISVKSKIKKQDDYFIAIRHINATDSGSLKIKVKDYEYKVFNPSNTSFKWSFIGPLKLDSGNVNIDFINEGGFHALNVFSIIPASELFGAREKSQQMMSSYPNIYLKQASDYQKLVALLDGGVNDITYQMTNPTEYKIFLPKNTKWLVFSDHYDDNWRINKLNIDNYPAYAMINDFYVKDLTVNQATSFSEYKINFAPQEKEVFWIIISACSVSLVLLLICYKLVTKYL